LNSTETKSVKLPCGCIPGLGFCAEGRRLAIELDKAHEQTRNAPASDYGWMRYQQAQVNFYQHFRKEMKGGNTEN